MKNNKSRLTTDQIKEQLSNSVVKDLEITKELETSFMSYAMSVIVSRALPDVRDGFKPVHRRVLYAAYGLGMTSDKPYKKSARLVGEVIGKYHPHGDNAVYQTMVRMAQDFSLRYMLMDGHGNYGSIDGDSPAAMRYTEIRLSKISVDILENIDKDTVKFIENYDGNEQEPTVLPASFPNLLANGTNGIAVGMSTNMPPHNLIEICNAIKHQIHNPDCEIESLMEHIKGPDFPTYGQILGDDGIKSYFLTGKGSVTIRSKHYIEEYSNGTQAIIITEIPYAVNKTTLIEKIVELVKKEEVKEISDLRDESNRDGIRIVIELKRNSIPNIVLNKLYKSSQLQVNFAVNNLALVDGKPKILNLKEMITYYLKHQHEIIINKSKYDLKRAEERAHILEGLLKVISDIDTAIKIIKESPSTEIASEKLIEKFELSQVQAKAVLDMRLRSLTGLEKEKLSNELKELQILIKELNEIINSKDKRNEIIINKLDYFITKYGDERRTEILYGVSGNVDYESLIEKEDILITMSANNWFKRLPIDTYRVQNRGGVGVIGAKTHSDDSVEKIVVSNTHADLLFFTNAGKVYRIRGHEVPIGSRISKGVPAQNFLNIDKNEKVLTVITINSDEYENASLFFITRKGLVKRTSLEDFKSIRNNGKIAISLRENDELFNVHITKANPNIVNEEEKTQIFIGASNGRAVRFYEDNIRVMGRTAAGVMGIRLNESEHVVGSGTTQEGNKVLSIGTKGIGKLSDHELYRLAKRGSKGVITLKINEKTGSLVSLKLVSENDDLLIISTSGNVIRLKVNKISTISRNTAGVKIMNLTGKEKVKSIAIFKEGFFTDEELNDEDLILEEVKE